MSLEKASKLVEGSYSFQSYRSERQLEIWSTTPSNFYSFPLPRQSSKCNLLLSTLLPLIPPHPQSFLSSLYFHWNENRRVFPQSVPDRSHTSQQFASQTQMLGINTCQTLLCPTWKKDTYTMCTCRNWDSSLTFFSFWRCRNEAKKMFFRQRK